MHHSSATSTSKESKVVSLRNKGISDNNNNINDKSDTIVCYWNDTPCHKADHREAVTLAYNNKSSTHNAGENGERSTQNATKNGEKSTHNASENSYISTHINSNDRPTNRSANLQKDKTVTNGYSMFSNDSFNNSLLKFDDELVSNKLNHKTISNTDSVLQINIHEHDQFLLIPLHNNNEMLNTGWLIDKNKTCIELVRKKNGSPLSPLRPDQMIQLHKKFDVFEQKQSCTIHESNLLKSNLQQDFMSLTEVLQKQSDSQSVSEAPSIIKSKETSTVPNLSPPRKTSKTTTPNIPLSTPKVKKTTKNSIYQQPTKSGSVKNEDQRQRRIDNWFMESELKEAKSTTSTDIR